MEQIRGVRNEINSIHNSINIFQKPDSSFVLKMKRRAELLDVEEELMRKEDQLVRECKRLFNDHKATNGIGSAVSSMGNYLYGCGAWTVKKMKFW